MLIDGVTNADAIPALSAMVEFAGKRQELIAHNVANISTPNFRPVDVSVERFRGQLAEAVDRRRERFGGQRGDLRMSPTKEVAQDRSGRLWIRPTEAGRNVLFHDRNNRDVERLMQDLAENTAVFRVATDLLRAQTEQLRSAISLRV